MDDYLYHAWLKKGEQAKEHKYTKREWKNDRWVYYYENASGQLYPKGQNYQTIDQVKANKAASKAAYEKKQAANKKQAVERYKADKQLDELVNKGKKYLGGLLDTLKLLGGR